VADTPAEAELPPPVQISDPHMEAMMQMCERFRAAMHDAVGEFEDPRDAIAVAMTAGIVFAGMQAGSLIAMGDYQETAEQYAQFNLMLETNFPCGIRFGKLHAARTMAKMGSMN